MARFYSIGRDAEPRPEPESPPVAGQSFEDDARQLFEDALARAKRIFARARAENIAIKTAQPGQASGPRRTNGPSTNGRIRGPKLIRIRC